MEAWYRLSLDLSPDRTAAERLAWLYRRQGRDNEAAAMWRRLAQRFAANSADYWWAVGSAAEFSRDWEQAAWAYGKGSGLAEHPYIFWIRQGAAYERLQGWSEAEAAYDRALAARSDLALPYLSLGHLQRNQENYQQALEWYRQAGSVAVGEGEPLYYQGLVHFLLEEDLEARDLLERALAVNPGDVMATYYLAQTLYRLGDFSGAMALLAQAIDLHLGEPWQWARQLGDWYLVVGERDEALAAYSRALEWNAGDADLEERIAALRKKE
jgi:tetratricopeptide (TPR) repeat protein